MTETGARIQRCVVCVESNPKSDLAGLDGTSKTVIFDIAPLVCSSIKSTWPVLKLLGIARDDIKAIGSPYIALAYRRSEQRDSLHQAMLSLSLRMIRLGRGGISSALLLLGLWSRTIRASPSVLASLVQRVIWQKCFRRRHVHSLTGTCK